MNRASSGQCLLGASLTGVCAAVGSALLLGAGLGGLNPIIAAVALLTGLVAAGFTWRSIPPGSKHPVDAWLIVMAMVFALASLRAFLWLLYPVGDEWRILSPYNLGDLSLHIQFIRYFAGGVPFWPESPILSGVPLSYPVGADLWNSLLLLCGIPLERGLIWTALGGALLTGVALARWGGAFAMAAFLFAGGLAGLRIFQTGSIEDFQSGVEWKNLFLTMFVTQRGLLYALPCGLFLMNAWRERLFGSGHGVPWPVLGLLYATMPVFSIHAFLFLSTVLAVAFVLHAPSRSLLAAFVGAAFLPASALVWCVTGGFSVQSGLRWLPGWMQDDAPILFWAVNFGLALPLTIWLAGRVFLKGPADARVFVGAAGIVFLASCFISFAPWPWDNTKLMIWAWLAVAPFLWDLVLRPWPVLWRSLAVVGLFATGGLSLIGGLDGRHGYTLVKKSELHAASEALKNVPFGARIAVEPRFNHPVLLLGHPVVCGYDGHLWSHGLPYQKPMQALQGVLKREEGWRGTALGLGADAVYFNGTPPVVELLPSGRNRPPEQCNQDKKD